jgi:DNA-binding CsgD family transcriptional regulator
MNLKDIVSPFIGKLSLEYLRLTPTELRVADLIRHGNRTKEIAEMLGLSAESIRFYRKKLRQKLGIKQKEINLRTFLMSKQG